MAKERAFSSSSISPQRTYSTGQILSAQKWKYNQTSILKHRNCSGKISLRSCLINFKSKDPQSVRCSIWNTLNVCPDEGSRLCSLIPQVDNPILDSPKLGEASVARAVSLSNKGPSSFHLAFPSLGVMRPKAF